MSDAINIADINFQDTAKLKLSADDLLAITDEWEQTSARKTELIEKKIRKEANDDELKELARLKMLTEARGELFAPLPLPQLAVIKSRLQAKGRKRHSNDHGNELGTGCVGSQGCPTLWTTNSRF